jgi:membrane associated rhomboid family serine protease
MVSGYAAPVRPASAAGGRSLKNCRRHCLVGGPVEGAGDGPVYGAGGPADGAGDGPAKGAVPFAMRRQTPYARERMFPIRDDNPQILKPIGTYVLIGLNLLAWVLVQGLGATRPLGGSICQFGLVPAKLLQTLPAGASVPVGEGLVCQLGGSGWYTVITSMFMHGGWMHLIGNMWFLWIFGDNVEDAMGTRRFLIFYLLCGFAAAALQVAFDPGSTVPMVGASGAIGGVMGAYVVLYPRVHVHMLVFLGFFVTTFAVPAIFMLGYWIVIQLVSGVLSLGAQGGGVAFWAHVGGFVAGAVLIFAFRNRRLLARHPYHGWHQKASATQRWHRIRRR